MIRTMGLTEVQKSATVPRSPIIHDRLNLNNLNWDTVIFSLKREWTANPCTSDTRDVFWLFGMQGVQSKNEFNAGMFCPQWS